MFTDCFNRIINCSIRVFRSICKLDGRVHKYLGEPWPCQACLLATSLFETTVSCVSHVSAILVSDYSCFMLLHSLEFWNYFCQNSDLLFLKLCWHIRRKPTYSILLVISFVNTIIFYVLAKILSL